MNVIARSIDRQGWLWLVEPLLPTLCASVAAWDLHASRPDDTASVAAQVLRGGASVVAYDEPSSLSSLVASLDRLTRGDAIGAIEIANERSALRWFLASDARLLLLGPVAFEKQRREVGRSLGRASRASDGFALDRGPRR